MRAVMVFVIVAVMCSPVFAQDSSSPPAPLTMRRPTYEQVTAYLTAYMGVDPMYSPARSLHAEPLRYADLNGDGEDDLIFDGMSYMAILLWQGNAYDEPFQHSEDKFRKYDSRVAFQDVTNDGVPEVVFDATVSYLESGAGGIMYNRDVIHCAASTCWIVWHARLFDTYGQYPNEWQIVRMDPTFEVVDGTPQITATWRGICALCTRYLLEGVAPTCGLIHPYSWVAEPDWPAWEKSYDFSIPAYQVTELRYVWNGGIFKLVETSHSEAPYVQAAFNVTEATNADGVRASLVDASDQFPPPEYESYAVLGHELLIDDQPTSFVQLSLPEFSLLTWRDITGDGVEELVWHMTYFRSQRIMAFQLIDDELIVIADVYGMVRDANLFGVRLEDCDDDGQLEIISAGEELYQEECVPRSTVCMVHLTDTEIVYEWNGTAFVATEP